MGIGFAVLTLQAQNNTSSPYSVFGIGQVPLRGDAVQAGMGYAGVGWASASGINTLNPASYTQLDSLAFYFNLQIKGYQSLMENSRQQSTATNGNIDAVSMAFKVARNWGMGFGYLPYSQVGYSIQGSKYLIGTNEKYPVLYEGNGGLNQVYLTNAVRLWKGLSVGVNLSLLWGKLNRTETSTYPQVAGETIYNEKNYYLNHLLVEYGVQYIHNSGANQWGIGGVIHAETQLFGTYNQRIYNDVSSDLYNQDQSASGFSVPLSWSVGASWRHHSGWGVVADYGMSRWSAVDNPKSEQVRFSDSYRAGMGAEYTVPRNTDRRYLARLKYRVGMYRQQSYWNINGKKVVEHGLTAGISFPLNRWGNLLNVSYAYGTMGGVESNMWKETTHTVRLGMTIKEMWFVKQQFE